MNLTHQITKKAAALCGVALASGCALFSLQADSHEQKAEYSMEDIMTKGHKGDDSLLKKALEGRADESELKQLIDYYLALEKYDPPKGDKESWVAKTSALSKNAIYLFAKKDGAAEGLKEASNCRACHTKHRPD